jgi:hypothetical protein
MELTYRYGDAAKRAAMKTKLDRMSTFERKRAVDKLRAKREEGQQQLTSQRVAISTFFSTYDPSGKSPFREQLIKMAMAARRPIKDEKWVAICARLGQEFQASPNAYL